jgi:alcohol dehydrogenase
MLQGSEFGNKGTPGWSASIRKLAIGASAVGAAINEAHTTAAHALSYWLTGFKGIAHGVAVGINMPWLLTFNNAVSDKDCRHPMGPAFVRGVIREVDTISDGIREAGFCDVVHELLSLAGGPVELASLGLTFAEWRYAVADSLSSDRALNNPRKITENVLIQRFSHEWGLQSLADGGLMT